MLYQLEGGRASSAPACIHMNTPSIKASNTYSIKYERRARLLLILRTLSRGGEAEHHLFDVYLDSRRARGVASGGEEGGQGLKCERAIRLAVVRVSERDRLEVVRAELGFRRRRERMDHYRQSSADFVTGALLFPVLCTAAVLVLQILDMLYFICSAHSCSTGAQLRGDGVRRGAPGYFISYNSYVLCGEERRATARLRVRTLRRPALGL